MTVRRPTGIRFSISIPALGQSEFLATALSSLRSQRASVDLAVLDASPDDRVQQVLSAQGMPLAYGYHRPDRGQAAAIQEGWDQTTGDIVSWLCADDYYFPDALAVVADAFNAHPEADVVFGHAVHVSETCAFESYFPSTDPEPAALVRGCTISQPACFVRRSAMERIGGLNADLHFVMDWDFWLRLYGAGCHFRFVDAPLAAVRIHRHSKTMSGGRRRREEIAALLKAHRVPSFPRWRAQMAFWKYDVKHRPSSAGLRQGLDMAATIVRRLYPSGPSMIRGLECGTNRVTDDCDVRLPWYDTSPAREAIVVTDRPVGVTVTINNRPGALEPLGPMEAASSGSSVRGHGYRVPFALPQSELLSFRFGGEPEPWRLLGLAVR